MDEPPEEAPDESSNYKNTAQPPGNQKIKGEGGAGEATHKGSEHAGVGSSEATGDEASGQAGSKHTDQRSSEELTDYRSPSRAERKTSQQVDRRSSSQAERRTSESPNQQTHSPLEGKTSEWTDEDPESDNQTSSDKADFTISGKNPRQVYNQDGYQDEDLTDQQWSSEDEETESSTTEKEIEYRSSYKTSARREKLSLSEVTDNEKADQNIQLSTFKDNQAGLRSKTSTGGETENASTSQAYNLPYGEFSSDIQSSYEKLPSITTKTYYSSSQDKFQTTETTPVGKGMSDPCLGGWRPRQDLWGWEQDHQRERFLLN